jgi:hypothetical protein
MIHNVSEWGMANNAKAPSSVPDIGRLYSVQYKSIFGAPNKVRRVMCDEAKPLSQVWGVEPNTSLGYEVAEPPHHHHTITRMQDCIPT